MRQELEKELRELYSQIYGEKEAEQLLKDVDKLIKNSPQKNTKQWLTQKDAVLITYGDSIIDKEEPGLKVLNDFLKKHVADAISIVHILPMFPYTSDDGFSVSDYRKVNPALGDWEDVNRLGESYDLMFDAVINHCSKSNEWFQKCLKGEKPYKDFFIEADPKADYSKVTRPRALPLLTEFDTKEGKKSYWTTFSTDQIDLNYQSIDLYKEILSILLYYTQNGARMIRLDAIGFLWKELGTTCMHLPQTHKVVQSFRKILDEAAPGTLIITETNVPHKENISYFGEGEKEAHMVYQFPLPPLVMFSILTGNSEKLTEWAKNLSEPPVGCTYFNFLSSHDGIGVRPVEGILTKEEIQLMVDATLRNGGEVSYKDNGDGTKSPYELNINYQDALASPEDSDEIRIKRFLAAETILLSMQGLPAIYIHSLLGSRNDYYDKAVSGIYRRINREQLDVSWLERQLTEETNRKKIFEELIRRINIRKEHPAFAPEAKQEVILTSSKVFHIRRFTEEERLTIYINISEEVWQSGENEVSGKNLLTGKEIKGTLVLSGYEAAWILENNSHNKGKGEGI